MQGLTLSNNLKRFTSGINNRIYWRTPVSDIRDLYKLVRTLEEGAEALDETIQLHDSFDIELNESFVIETGVIGFTEDGIIVEADEKTLEFLEINDVLVESEELTENPALMALGRAAAVGFGSQLGDRAADKIGLEEVDELDEIKRLSAVNEGSSEGVYNSVVRRIMHQHTDVLAKFGPVKVMQAVEDLAQDLDDLDEIGSSDVSIWTKEVIRNLESGQYDHLDEAEYQGRKVPLGKPMKGDVAKSKVYVRKPNGKVVKVNFGDKNMRIKKSNPNRRKSFRARHNCDNPGPRWKARYWSCRAW